MKSSSYQNFFGVDVASNKLDIVCAHSNQHVEIPNSADAIESWTKRIKRLKGKTLVVMEATGMLPKN